MVNLTSHLGTVKAILANPVKSIVIVLTGIAITNGNVFASSTENTECPPSDSSLVEALSNICKRSNQLTVSYGESSVECGTSMCMEDTKNAPTVTYPAAKEDVTYVLVMVDPDAPGSSLRDLTFYLHWIVTNIKGTQLINGERFKPKPNNGIEYMGPSPPPGSGPHMYKFVLFETVDQKHLTTDENGERAEFSLKDFVKHNGICTLTGVFEFSVEIE